jgi:hypothetical protein
MTCPIKQVYIVGDKCVLGHVSCIVSNIFFFISCFFELGKHRKYESFIFWIIFLECYVDDLVGNLCSLIQVYEYYIGEF